MFTKDVVGRKKFLRQDIPVSINCSKRQKNHFNKIGINTFNNPQHFDLIDTFASKFSFPYMKTVFRKIFFSLASTSFLVLLIMSCAQVGSLSGGPKDKKPPVVIEMIPPNYSTHFTGRKFEIKFNEFVKLDKINEQLLVSPPIKEFPDFKLKGKTLVVKFKEDLKPNTTYTVFFGDAVKDITEGNPIHNFTYIFSTGDYVDSLSMFGNVVFAEDLIPMGNVEVMLYRDNNDTIKLDSMPLEIPPYYVTRTDKKGDYFMTGIADDKYLVFALKDKNNNYFFDQPTEEIAFLDTLYHPVYIEKPSIDTSYSDTTSLKNDSLVLNIPAQDSLSLKDSTVTALQDSLTSDSLFKEQYKPVNLRMFVQEDTVLRLEEAELIRLNTIRFVFSLPADSVKINLEHKPAGEKWYAEEWSKNKDTLTWYLHEKEITIDTFNILLKYKGDTLDYIYIPVKPKEKRVPGRRKKNDDIKKIRYLDFVSNMKGNLKPDMIPYIIFNQPVSVINFDSVVFIAGEDTVYSPEYKFTDSLKRKLILPYKIEPGLSYLFYLPDSAVMDWNGYYNKSSVLKFSSKELKDYGTLTFNVNPEDTSHYILQFLNAKEKVLAQKHFTHDTSFTFNYIDPGKYLFKIILDENNNGKWDTGNYFKKRQPEKVTYYNKLLQVRANWEIEESWIFDKNDQNPPPIKRKPRKD